MAKVQQPIVPSRLYRYRSLIRSAEALGQEIDAIVENYLYCAEFTRANDPMEGFYRSSRLLRQQSDYRTIISQLLDSKLDLGIASFTETKENVLMWAHYASNYTGICLAYSTKALLAGLSRHVDLVRVAYVDDPPLVSPSHVVNAADAAVRILSQKKYNWSYEREWRILGRVGLVSIGRCQAVRAIYFGSRIRQDHRKRILGAIKGTEIKAYTMDVDGYDHTWKAIPNSGGLKSGNRSSERIGGRVDFRRHSRLALRLGRWSVLAVFFPATFLTSIRHTITDSLSSD